MTSQERIAGGQGTYGVANTTQVSRAFEFIQINADAVISELTYSDNSDALTDLNLATTTWSAGILIAAPMGKSFKSITLASGSVNQLNVRISNKK